MGIRIPTSTTSNPSGNFHNGAETKFLPNPSSDPELIYRAGLDADERHSTTFLESPEFMNPTDLTKVKDYAVYDKNISASEKAEVETAVGASFAASFVPSDLANADRLILSEWDASEASSITEVTGVSEMADLIGSLDFVQATEADQPILSNGGTPDALITYDAGNDFLSQAVNSGNFQNLTYFEYWCIVDLDTTLTRQLAFEINGGSANDRIFMHTDTVNRLNIGNKDNSSTLNSGQTSNLGTGKRIVGYIFTGSEFKVFVNGVGQALTIAGSNNGKFVGDLVNKTSIDVASIGAKLSATPSFAPNKEQHGIAIGGTSTAAATTLGEQGKIVNYINIKNNLGL